jgi:hypothetical protein
MMIPNPNSKRILMYDYPQSGFKTDPDPDQGLHGKNRYKILFNIEHFFLSINRHIGIFPLGYLGGTLRSVKASSPTESSSNMKFPRIIPDFVYHNGLPGSGSG